MVVIGMDQQEVTVLHPLKGERSLPLRVFDSAWTTGFNLIILIER